MAPEAAVMFVEPTAKVVANPELLIVATPVAEELQVAEPVRLAVLESLYVPVALNCCVSPLAIDGFTGVTPIDTNVAGSAVSVVEPTTAPSVAEMLLAPLAATTVASPPVVIVAVPSVPDAQVTDAVRLCVPLSV